MMDAYTLKAREWLDARYRQTAADGVYFAHQPIYGLHDPHSEPNVLARYLRTWRVLSALSGLDGVSLLDVGASEGFQASLAGRLLGLSPSCCDLSAEACRRATGIFGLPAEPADARALPYADARFDLVVCSETLEHVRDFERAVAELLRVAAKAVVVTVPHEPPGRVKHNVESGELHAHINAFGPHSFDRFASEGLSIQVLRFQSHRLWRVTRAIERHRLGGSGGRLVSRVLVAAALRLDPVLLRTHPGYGGLLFVLRKGAASGRAVSRRLRVRDVLRHAVPHQRLRA